MDIIEALKMIRTTMDAIEVKGLTNMSKLLGCADMLATVIQILETPTTEDADPQGPESKQEIADD